MRITITTSPQNKKPKAGDRRTTKKHGLQIRVQCMARSMNGKPIGRMVSGSRPVFAWRKPVELDEWDLHHLTQPESDALRIYKQVRRDIERGIFFGSTEVKPDKFDGLGSVTNGSRK